MAVVLHTDSLMVSLDQRPHFTDGERGAQVGRWVRERGLSQLSGFELGV